MYYSFTLEFTSDPHKAVPSSPVDILLPMVKSTFYCLQQTVTSLKGLLHFCLDIRQTILLLENNPQKVWVEI